jgi:sulfur relay (sulfurtransferase) DsrC/TusE family protein
MANIKQSIVVQRQIPEHIRNSYPLFVEFVKAYYEFLDQSQTRSLEEVRDIDLSLDEFIDKFKSELAKNVPIELSSDKRKLIKHLKEFYLSRGSEASYKFLFNTLFNQNAELFYPSTQILKASDGKWKQDISIFVELNNGTETLQPVNGKFIKINTNRKTIETFVENVVQYDFNTFEIFIQREYSNEIAVGAIITYEENGVVYTGTVVQCPAKLKIFKAGKGFKPGDIFALKTQLGRGCIVKVTKTNSEGGILSIQVIRFGLDYKTKFYSYLSNKGYEAFEYTHPLKLYPNYNGTPNPIPPNDPAYNERSGGFIDYGFSSKQTYMFYDEEIPVGTPDRRSDRYFVDGTYVGDIQSQFYADASTNAVDEDLAIIEIELGAVAKYPGYYLNADGFISDEMYIHDGNYYQAFSYVIKVEEELRAYADIVRALVHPSGMKLFAEYSIYRELKLQFTRTLIRSALQLPFDGSPPSNVNIIDAGFNYNNYVFQDGKYVPTEDAGLVFSRQGKAALFLLKQINDATQNEIISGIQFKIVDKNINSDQPQLSTQEKFVEKPLLDLLDTIENIAKNTTKPVNSNQPQLSTQEKFVDKSLLDVQPQLSTQAKFVEKPINEIVENFNDNIVKHYFKNPSSLQELIEISVNNITKPLLESQASFDNIGKEVIKPIQSILTEYISIVIKRVFKNIEDLQNLESVLQSKNIEKRVNLTIDPVSQIFKGFETGFIDNINSSSLPSNNLMKNFVIGSSAESTKIDILAIKNILEEIQVLIDRPTFVISKLHEEFPEAISFTNKLYEKIITGDEISTTDFIEFSRLIELFSTIEIIDTNVNSFTKNINELLIFEEAIQNFTSKEVNDSQGQLSNINKQITKELSTQYSNFIENIVLDNSKVFTTFQSSTDERVTSFAKSFASLYSDIIDSDSIELNKTASSAINTSMNGRMKLSSAVYDSEDYYEVFQDFQPLTQLS